MLVLFLAGTIAIENYEAVAGISMLCWIGIPGALIVWLLTWAWYAYRLVLGFTTLEKQLPMPGPDH